MASVFIAPIAPSLYSGIFEQRGFHRTPPMLRDAKCYTYVNVFHGKIAYSSSCWGRGDLMFCFGCY